MVFLAEGGGSWPPVLFRNWIRSFRVLLAGVCLLCWLNACDSDDPSFLRLTGWIATPLEQTLTQSLLDTYMEQRPGFRIHYEPITANYMDKLLLMLGTGTAPDVVMLEAFWIPLLAAYDVLLPLDGLVARDAAFDAGDFEPVLLDAFRCHGRLYGLPKDYSTLALFYNPSLYAEAGLLKPPRTWDEFASHARLLTRDRNGDGIMDQYGYGHSEGLEYSLPFVWQNLGEYFDTQGRAAFTDPAFVEALDFLRRLQINGVAVLPSQVGGTWNMDAFGRGRVAMAISGLWAVNFLQETYPRLTYGISPLPMGRKPASVAFVVGYAIPKQSRHPRQAWQLLRYLTSEEGGRVWAQAKVGLPPRRSLAKASSSTADPLRHPFVEALAISGIWQFNVNQRVLDETETALQAVFLTGAPVRPALQDLKGRLERAGLLQEGRASLAGAAPAGAR